MVSIQDFFGGSQRRAALQLLDQSLSSLQVNPAYIDDGMRFAIYRWVRETAAGTVSEHGVADALMHSAAEMISFCVLGSTETEATWGAEARAAREARFSAVLTGEDDETFDAKLIKLVLAKGIAARDIQARVSLEDS